MKPYSSSPQLLAATAAALAAKASLSTRTALDDVVQLLRDGRHYLWTSVYLRSDEKTLVRMASAGPETQCYSVELGVGNVGWTAQTGAPRLTPDVSSDRQYRDVLPQTRSELAMPIKIGDRVLGVINVESEQTLVNHDLVLIKEVAEQLVRFLTRQGKYVMMRAKEFSTPVPGKRPQRDLPQVSRRAAGR